MMPLYHYKARDKNGLLVTGKMEKETEQEVIDFVKGKEYTLLKIRRLSFWEKDIQLFQPKISKRALSIYCMQFSCMNIAGITIEGLLEILQTQTTDKLLKKQIIFLRESVVTGKKLSDAMRETDKFPELMINMTEVGEKSGELSKIYEKMSLRYKKEDKFERDVQIAFAYPLTIAVLLLGVVMIAVTVLIPNFARVYENNEAELPFATIFLIAVSDFLVKNQFLILVVLILFLCVCVAVSVTGKGKYVIDKFFVKVPIVNNFYMKSVNAKFTGVLSLLMETGYDVIKSIETSKKVLNNLFLDEILDDIIANVKKGDGLGESIMKAEVFGPVLYRMVSTGEVAGQLPYVLSKCAESFDDAVEREIARLSKLIGPISIIVLGFMIGFVMLAIMLPIFSLGQVL